MDSKKLSLYYFSGTGNTYLAAQKIAEVFNKNDYVSTVEPIEKADAKTINLNATIGIGFPIAGWNTYPIVTKFLQDMPEGKGTQVFLFSTMCDSAAKATAELANTLKHKGYNVLSAREFKMPNNMLLIQADAKNKAKLEKGLSDIESFAESILSGNMLPEKSCAISKISFKITNFAWKLLMKSFFQKILRFKLKEKVCSKCKLCAKICPTQNIILNSDGFPKWELTCVFCLRCVSYCPQNAVKFFILGSKTYKALTPEEANKCFKPNF
ncbi:MAG: EFR1 family ferrodoxin [Elusimicrobia bacterium]|nr:EFR1 family ferrodoxin [Elusimicrobiota bacterium]